MHPAIRILRDEHRSIACVLHGLQQLAHLARDRSARPDFTAFRAMIYYLDTFPERLHHPKEDEHLYARLEARSPQDAPLVNKLRADHKRGAALLRELEHALTACEDSWPEGSAPLALAVKKYADLQWDHMRRQEHVLLPVAETALTEQDWRAISEAFAENHDPLAGLRERDFEGLCARMATIAGVPAGIAESSQRMAA